MTNQTASGSQALAASGYLKERDYWLGKLAGELPVAGFPADYAGTDSYTEASYQFSFSGPVFANLMRLANESDQRLLVILAASLVGLLNRYTNQQGALIGTTILRQQQGGDFINTTIVLRGETTRNTSFRDLVLATRTNLIEALAHQNYPYAVLQRQLIARSGENREALFEVALVLENIQDPAYLPARHAQTCFQFRRQDDSLVGIVSFNASRYQADTIRRICGHLFQWLEQSTSHTDIKLSAIDLLSEEEKARQRYQVNPGGYPLDKTFRELFELQATRTPDAIAVAFGISHLTYLELDERANQVAQYLRQNTGLQPDDLVAVLLPRSENLLLVLLATLKAGAAFLPVDLNYPVERVAYMIEQAEPRVLVASFSKMDFLYELPGAPLLFLENLLRESEDYPRNPPPHTASALSLAYVLYTSGSTGTPKGVQVQQRSLVNYLLFANEYYFQNRAGHHFALCTSLAFDLTLTSIFSTLLRGDTVHVYPEAPIEDILLDAFRPDTPVNCLKITPSHVSLLTHLPLKNTNVGCVILGGEALAVHHIQTLRTLNPTIRIFNEYGPTEATVGCTVQEVPLEPTAIVTIGRPIPNSVVYVLDPDLNPCPTGVPGELYIGGIGVAMGYLKRPELTDVSFLVNPFPEGGRLYKTGDLGKWLPNDQLQYLGRIDNQVKIRGYRVELAEIEHVVMRHDRVVDCVVVDQVKNEDQFLIAYYTTAEPGLVTDLNEFVGQYIPEYMIPTYFVQVSQMPLTSNGKVDRTKLPDPLTTIAEDLPLYVAPRNDQEKTLMVIWQQVLQRDDLGVETSFFTLGGHSLKAIQIISQVHSQLGVKLSMEAFFASPTIAAQAEIISHERPETYDSIHPVDRQHSYALSNAQKRLWILNSVTHDPTVYTIPVAFTLTGDLNRLALQQAFVTLIDRHESLRTTFTIIEGQPQQQIHPTAEFPFSIEEASLPEDSDEEKAIQGLIRQVLARRFDLTHGPLLRVTLVHTHIRQHLLLVTMHHIISDGWSMGVLTREFIHFYNAFATGRFPSLAPLRVQYKDYTAWQEARFKDGMLAEDSVYWLDQFRDTIPILSLPTDYPRPKIRSSNGQMIVLGLGKDRSERLKALGEQHGCSVFTVLIAALKALFYRYTGQEDIVVGTTTAGRDHLDLDGQIGFYVNVLPLRTRFDGTASFVSLLEQVKRVTLGAYTHQFYPFEQLIDDLDLEVNTSRSPLFDVLVEFLNADTGLENGQSLHGLVTTQYGLPIEQTKFDMSFRFVESDGQIVGYIEYNHDLYASTRMELMKGHYSHLLDALLANSDSPVRELNYLTDAERQVLRALAAGPQQPNPETSYSVLFESVAATHPAAIALVAGQHTLTYEGLNQAANRLAYYLLRYPLTGAPIGLLLERSERMVIALLAVLKTGMPFLPLDPTLGSEKNGYGLADAGVALLLTDSHLIHLIGPSYSGALVALDLQLPQLNGGDENPGAGATADELAYVLYTSGSTGQSKGVEITMGNFNNYVQWANNYYFNGQSGHLFALCSPLVFDLTITSIFSTLLRGDTLYVCSNGEASQILLEVFSPNTVINTVKLTPSHVHLLNGLNLTHTNVTCAIVGGEALTGEHVRTLRRLNPAMRIFNEYGPTETTVGCTVKEIGDADKLITIGRPVTNTQVFVLDERLDLQPVGAIGEIAVGGSGVARGYLNAASLTAEKFVQVPCLGLDTGRVYLTGDLGHWTIEGDLVYMGRKDNQLKIAGHRIEPAEVEAALLTYDGVEAAIVVAKPNHAGQNELIAYLLGGGMRTVEELRNHLTPLVPGYMIPAHFVPLAYVPLTPNGKVNYKALAEVATEELISAKTYIAPGSDAEHEILTLWKDVLGRQHIGVEDNFFDLGGNSLKIVLLFQGLSLLPSNNLQIGDLFDHPTIRAQAALLTDGPVGRSGMSANADFTLLRY